MASAQTNLSPADQDAMTRLVRDFNNEAPEPQLAAFRALIDRNPLAPVLHNNLGVLLRRLGREDQAGQCYKNALKVDPKNSDAAYNFGNLKREKGDHLTALRYYKLAVSSKPDHASALINLGCTYRDLEQYQESRAVLIKAIRLVPGEPEAHNNLAATLWKLKLFPAALSHYRRAMALKPNHPRYLANCGVCLMDMERYDEALETLKQALALKPSDADILGYLGQCCTSAGALDDALAYFKTGLEIQPEHLDCNLGRARALLLSGDLVEGWRAYEWRWKRSREADTRSDKQWRGEDINGKTLHLTPEQGVGDILQFVRYVPILEQMGAKVSMSVPDGVRRLVSSASSALALYGEKDPLPETDFTCALLDVPEYCGITPDAIPAPQKYLSVPPEAKTPISKLDGASAHIGLVWAGNPDHRRDLYRSIPLTRLLPITEIPGLAYYSLQKGERRWDLRQHHCDALLPDLVTQAEDYADTGNVVEQLDLVVTVDTSVAHLAAALGKPVWVLIPKAPDWRWLLDRTDTPWYPTMRIFRTGTDWDLSELTGELKRLATGDLTL